MWQLLHTQETTGADVSATLVETFADLDLDLVDSKICRKRKIKLPHIGGRTDHSITLRKKKIYNEISYLKHRCLCGSCDLLPGFLFGSEKFISPTWDMLLTDNSQLSAPFEIVLVEENHVAQGHGPFWGNLYQWLVDEFV